MLQDCGICGVHMPRLEACIISTRCTCAAHMPRLQDSCRIAAGVLQDSCICHPISKHVACMLHMCCRFLLAARLWYVCSTCAAGMLRAGECCREWLRVLRMLSLQREARCEYGECCHCSAANVSTAVRRALRVLRMLRCALASRMLWAGE